MSIHFIPVAVKIELNQNISQPSEGRQLSGKSLGKHLQITQYEGCSEIIHRFFSFSDGYHVVGNIQEARDGNLEIAFVNILSIGLAQNLSLVGVLYQAQVQPSNCTRCLIYTEISLY